MSEECDLLGPFSWLVQGILMVMSLSSLIVKRYYEWPRRTVTVWLMDTSKQAAAASSEHFINLFLASIFGGGEIGEGDPCVWYFLSGFTGFAFGTPFAYVMVQLQAHITHRFDIKALKNTGVYNDEIVGPPLVSWWLAQMSVWLLIIMIQRTCMGLLFSVPAIHTALGAFGSFILAPVQDTFYEKIVVVVIVLPVLINSAEFWVQDNFLMEQDTTHRLRRHSIVSGASETEMRIPSGGGDGFEKLQETE